MVLLAKPDQAAHLEVTLILTAVNPVAVAVLAWVVQSSPGQAV